MERGLLRIGFLASHNGTDMRAIVGEIESGKLNAYPAVIISNNSRNPLDESGIRKQHTLEFAREHNIPAYQINDSKHEDFGSADEAIRSVLLENGVEIIILSGYMKIFGENSPVLKEFEGRIWNVHPADPEKYRGYWGDTLFEKLLESGDEYVEPVVHEAIWPVDSGKELARGKVRILPNTKDSLKAAIQKEESRLFIHLLQAEIASRS